MSANTYIAMTASMYALYGIHREWHSRRSRRLGDGGRGRFQGKHPIANDLYSLVKVAEDCACVNILLPGYKKRPLPLSVPARAIPAHVN